MSVWIVRTANRKIVEAPQRRFGPAADSCPADTQRQLRIVRGFGPTQLLPSRTPRGRKMSSAIKRPKVRPDPARNSGCNGDQHRGCENVWETD